MLFRNTRQGDGNVATRRPGDGILEAEKGSVSEESQVALTNRLANGWSFAFDDNSDRNSDRGHVF